MGLLPTALQYDLEAKLKRHPEALARAKVYPSQWHKMHLIHIWVVRAPADSELRFRTMEPDKHGKPDWRPVGELLANLGSNPVRVPYAAAVAKALRREDATRGEPKIPTVTTMTGTVPLEETTEVTRLRRELNMLAATCVTMEEHERLHNARWALAQECTARPNKMHVVAAAIQQAVPKRPATAAKARGVLQAGQDARLIWQKYATQDLIPDAEVIRDEQREDLWCSEIRDHLLTEYIPPYLRGPAMMRFKVIASDYTLRGGLLFRVHQDPRLKKGAYQLAIPVTLREPFLEAFHERLEHPGANRTYAGLTARAY